MNRKIMYSAVFTGSLFLFSCKDTDTKAIQMTEDSTASGGGGGGTKKAGSADSAAMGAANLSSQYGTSGKDSSAGKMPVVQSVSDNTKIKPPVKLSKKKSVSSDTAARAGDDNLPAARKINAAATDNSKTTINTSNIAGKPFVSKYGTIPRNATQDNITEFLVAFPDKTILIKINYNSDPDAEMQAVKTQVEKVLKKSGYTNISDQSLTLHPMHVPKDIHYELQHDQSVVIWIPPASADQ